VCTGSNSTLALALALALAYSWAGHQLALLACHSTHATYPILPAVAKTSAAAVPRFTSPATGTTFLFNSTAADYWSGVDFCAALGAYPAAFSSLLEQYQAESYFTQEVGRGPGALGLGWARVSAAIGASDSGRLLGGKGAPVLQ
jgi:hypothetical protein